MYMFVHTIPIRSEESIRKLDKSEKHTPKLWYASANDSTTVDHWPFLTNKETCTSILWLT